ncbi:MAG: hypothetical protein DDT34_01321 [Firmicutes bacterium]|nr:hypothetical protein [Bacillota bacterium]
MKNILVVALASALLLASATWMMGQVYWHAAAVPPVATTPPTESGTAQKNTPVGVPQDSAFSSHLPLILIDTAGQTIDRNVPVWATVAVIDNASRINRVLDQPTMVIASTIRYRGSSSYLTFDKAQFRLEFFRRAHRNARRDVPLLGMQADSDWVLHGPFLDRTLIRNRLIYQVARRIMAWAPDTRFSEVFVDGEYLGVYLLTESVKVSPARISLARFGLLSGETAYLVKREAPGVNSNPIATFGAITGRTSNELSISFPPASRLSDAQRAWISHDISRFERTLYADHFADPSIGYAAFIDVDSFVDYYIINEFALIQDAGEFSTVVYKDLHGRLKMAVWDFNNAFENYPASLLADRGFVVAGNNWFNRLLQDRNFARRVIDRYRELRQGVLSDEALLGDIDGLVTELGDAVKRNFSVWGYTFYENLLSRDADGLPRDPRSHADALTQLRDSIVARGAFLDAHIEDLYTLAIN